MEHVIECGIHVTNFQLFSPKPGGCYFVTAKKAISLYWNLSMDCFDNYRMSNTCKIRTGQN